MRQGADGPLKCIRHVAMKVVMESASPKSVKIIISRTSLQELMRAAVLCDSTTKSRKQMCGVRSIRYEVKKKRSTGGRRVEDGVLGEVGYAGLKVCHQVYHCLETDTMAAIHGDDITAEGEPEKLDCLDEILKQLVVVRSARQQKA